MLSCEAYTILKKNVLSQTTDEAASWVEQVTTQLSVCPDSKALCLGIAKVPKIIKRDTKILLLEEDRHKRQTIHKGWQPEKWSLIETIRILFNLSVIHGSGDEEAIFLQTYKITELTEQIAFLKGLPLYGNSNFALTYAKEAVRSNIQSIFAAVSQFNPYPAVNFSESEWNNMILKAVTWNYPLLEIYGIDDRFNHSLMKMLCEYAKEQEGAKRPVSIDLWRCVGPLCDDNALLDLEKMLNTNDLKKQYAAVLALRTCSSVEAKKLLDTKPKLVAQVKKLDVNWDTLNSNTI
jgi:hypothetical protein